ncbi:zinc ABC transporter substrate-binding protein [Pseudaminobacter sp. 19-2017]|uniref:Zinc ABC transporter substrate-binding protein n=1 Tax=Pseudaminobacter soli (ex Zhang et al. 2022) TaxID=2831468 RepID=A0A942E1N4_9HYPH|nr:zinc ABC transporter substrate-binding protein [Pseudaminobacter soli]MBS3649538.1 zinc ABC transporter substrate-binding protein [Pseudaminobacter soli]
MISQLRLAASFGLALVLGSSLPAAADGKLKVVASFSIIGDFARNVGGDRIKLTTLVGPDGDAHVFAPKPADAALMANADVVLVNGLHFEGFLTRLVKTSATKAAVVELSKGIQPLQMAEDREHDHTAEEHSERHDHSHEAKDVDPHAFQSIANARIYVKNIADAFCAADAAGCQTYRANAALYDAKLAETDAAVRAEMAAIPEDKRVVIASHDAFGYFSRDYGIVFRAPAGASTEADASASDVAALIRQVREEKASAIFVENITDRRLVEQISRETGLPVGGTLYSDALSAPDGPAATYIDLMMHNARTIRAAIIGE